MVNPKVSFLSFFYCLCIVLYAGMANEFTWGLGNITTIGNAVGMGLTFLVILAHRIKFRKNFWVVLTVFLLYGLFTTVNQGRWSLLWLSKWPIFFTMAYVLCQDLKDKLFVTIERIIFALCCISLVLWIIQVVSPSTIQSIVKTFEFSKPYSEEAKIEGNMLVYTLNTNFDHKECFGFFPRNAGVAWEPGAFGAFIWFGFFCNMLRIC